MSKYFVHSKINQNKLFQICKDTSIYLFIQFIKLWFIKIIFLFLAQNAFQTYRSHCNKSSQHKQVSGGRVKYRGLRKNVKQVEIKLQITDLEPFLRLR